MSLSYSGVLARSDDDAAAKMRIVKLENARFPRRTRFDLSSLRGCYLWRWPSSGYDSPEDGGRNVLTSAGRCNSPTLLQSVGPWQSRMFSRGFCDGVILRATISNSPHTTQSSSAARTEQVEWQSVSTCLDCKERSLLVRILQSRTDVLPQCLQSAYTAAKTQCCVLALTMRFGCIPHWRMALHARCNTASNHRRCFTAS